MTTQNCKNSMQYLDMLLSVKAIFDNHESTDNNGYLALLEEIETIKKRCELDITISNIIDAYCWQEHIPFKTLASKSRIRKIVDERKYIGYFIIKHKEWIDGFSLEKLGSALGGQDHSTMINLRKGAKSLIETDREFATKFNRIEATLKAKFSII